MRSKREQAASTASRNDAGCRLTGMVAEDDDHAGFSVSPNLAEKISRRLP